MDKIPFPDHLFPEKDKKTKDFLKRNWSGDIEKFINNCEKELNVERGYKQSRGVLSNRR